MKKTSLCLLLFTSVTLAIGFSSCAKDGEYNPGKKISKIYREIIYDNVISSPKSLSEAWTWDNGKLVKIDHYFDGQLSRTDLLSYDGNRISEYKTGVFYTSKFTYDGSKLKTIETYCSLLQPELVQKITVSDRSGKKIAKLSYQALSMAIGSNAKNCEQLSAHNAAMLRFLIPSGNMESTQTEFESILKSSHSKAGYILYTIEFKYDNGNVTEKTWISSEEDVSSARIKYAYDKYHNPFCNFYTINYGYDFSKNNITSETIIVPEGRFSQSYSYEYDEKWPLKRSLRYTNDNKTTIENNYYEYR